MSMATDRIITPITATESCGLVILVQAIFPSLLSTSKSVLQKQCNFLAEKGPLNSAPWLFQREYTGLWTRNLIITLIARKKKKKVFFSTWYETETLLHREYGSYLNRSWELLPCTMVWPLWSGLMGGVLVPSTTSQLLLDFPAERKWANCLSFPCGFKTQQGLEEGKVVPQRKGTALFLQRENLCLAYSQFLPWSAHEASGFCSIQGQDVTHQLLGNMLPQAGQGSGFPPKLFLVWW